MVRFTAYRKYKVCSSFLKVRLLFPKVRLFFLLNMRLLYIVLCFI